MPNFCCTSSRSFSQRLRSLGGDASVSHTSRSCSAQAPMKLSLVRSTPNRSDGAWLSWAKKARQSSPKRVGRVATADSQLHSSCSNALHWSKPSQFCPRRNAIYASWSSPRMPSSSPPYSRAIICSSWVLPSMCRRVVSSGLFPVLLRPLGTAEKNRPPPRLPPEFDSSCSPWGLRASALGASAGAPPSARPSAIETSASPPARPPCAGAASARAPPCGGWSSYSALLERTVLATGSTLLTTCRVAYLVSSAHSSDSCSG
mmetsp:Transcript_98373/g.278482  ORF Transcript_98373/g.278482 Transcript_98373/m.278482 type:complete len:260 (+) Transcript_98373:202-981(+)